VGFACPVDEFFGKKSGASNSRCPAGLNVSLTRMLDEGGVDIVFKMGQEICANFLFFLAGSVGRSYGVGELSSATT
jgi:hypothetical protein